MSLRKCPGSSSFAQPQIQLVDCPDCGTETEIWSDEAIGTCPECGRSVIRTGTTSCVDWCRYAEDCLGKEGFSKYKAMKADLLRSTLLRLVQDEADAESAAQCVRSMAFAEEIAATDGTLEPAEIISLTTSLILRGIPAITDEKIIEILSQAGCPPVVVDQCMQRLAEDPPSPLLLAARDAVVLGELRSGRCDAGRLQSNAAREIAARK